MTAFIEGDDGQLYPDPIKDIRNEIADQLVDVDEEICGVSYDHLWTPGDYECRRCGADLSDWNDEEEENDENE